jgi:hypothetical protein
MMRPTILVAGATGSAGGTAIRLLLDVPYLAQHLREVATGHENGILAGTNDIVEKITG